MTTDVLSWCINSPSPVGGVIPVLLAVVQWKSLTFYSSRIYVPLLLLPLLSLSLLTLSMLFAHSAPIKHSTFFYIRGTNLCSLSELEIRLWNPGDRIHLSLINPVNFRILLSSKPSMVFFSHGDLFLSCLFTLCFFLLPRSVLTSCPLPLLLPRENIFFCGLGKCNICYQFACVVYNFCFTEEMY